MSEEQTVRRQQTKVTLCVIEVVVRAVFTPSISEGQQ
jgi:hypothetical protein